MGDKSNYFTNKNADDLFQIRNNILNAQVDFCFSSELAAFYRSQNWLNATSVLDVGSGNGYFISQLSSQFPEKQYLGVDLDSELIQHASSKYSKSNLVFKNSDLYELKGNYDFVIMRAVIQYFTDIPKLLQHIDQLTSNTSSFLIIDAHYTEENFFSPNAPLMMNMFKELNDYASSHGADRLILSKISNFLKDNPWKKSWDMPILCTPKDRACLQHIYTIYKNITLLVEHKNVIELNFDSILDEWENWNNIENKFSYIGLHSVRLDKN